MSEEINYKTDVPKNWVLINFSDTCDSISLNGIKIKQKQYQQKGKYPVVDQGQELIGGYYDKDELVVSGEPPFIIFGDHTKVKKLVNFKFIAGADGVKVLKPYEFLNPKLFFHFMHCIKLPDKGYARHYQFLGKAEFPIPPLQEQQRIVSKIEEQFTLLDKGIESLKTAQAQLKVYRQAVLKWAFEGKLTGDWRKHNADKLAQSNLLEIIYAEKKAEILKAGKKWKEPTKPTEIHLEDIPQFASEWEYDFFTNITHNIGDVDHKMPKAKDKGIPYISTKDFDDTDGFSFDNAKRISEDDYNFLARKIFPEFNDILISRYGTVGEIRQVKTQDKFQASYSVAIVKTVKNETLVKYLIYCLQSDILQKQIRKYTRATAQPDLGLEHMRQFIVPLPSLSEQEEIIQEIESRLSVCDKIDESISTSLLQAEALRQSILKKAFEGKLVAQDPNDETASVLLERIKSEREKNKPVKKVKLKKEIKVKAEL